MENLKNKINNCNLSKKDKKELLDILDKEKPDYNNFIKSFLRFAGMKKLLDDFGDLFDL